MPLKFFHTLYINIKDHRPDARVLIFYLSHNILFSVLCLFIMQVQCSQILCKRSHKTSMDLAETVFTSFQHGPKRIRKYAVHVNVVTNIFVCFIQYETTIIYALYVATSAKQVRGHIPPCR